MTLSHDDSTINIVLVNVVIIIIILYYCRPLDQADEPPYKDVLKLFLWAGCPSRHPTNCIKALKTHDIISMCKKQNISILQENMRKNDIYRVTLNNASNYRTWAIVTAY